MNTASQQKAPEAPANTVDLNGRAMDNIAFIRNTMERSSAFTAVPGRGLIAMGCLAAGGAVFAGQRQTIDGWLYTWVAVAIVGCAIGVATLALKCRQEYGTMFAGQARRFALNLAPPVTVGALLTDAFDHHGLYSLMPGTWLLLYGVGVLAAGAFSVPVVPAMGVAFIVLGANLMLMFPHPEQVIVFAGFDVADVYLAAGFGGLHIAFGAFVARRYGG